MAQKQIYLLYKADGQSTADFAAPLSGPAAERLLQLDGVTQVRVHLDDADVKPAQALRMENVAPLPQAMVSIRAEQNVDQETIEAILAELADRVHGYEVAETVPLANEQHPAPSGERVYGMCQIALLQKPPRLGYEEWQSIWQDSHTEVALETQATFAYRQNRVLRPLGEVAPSYDAIVEENFPPGAMTSSQIFYDAEGDDELTQTRMDAMMASCQRFIDFDKIDVVPMSEYVFEG